MTTASRMHHNPARRGAVDSGSPSLPGTRGRAFLNVVLETSLLLLDSLVLFSLDCESLGEEGACFRLSSRDRPSRPRAPSAAGSQTVSAAGPRRKPSPGRCGCFGISGYDVLSTGAVGEFPSKSINCVRLSEGE